MNDFEDLKVIWVCERCNDISIFYEDWKTHCEITGHTDMSVYDLETGKLLKRPGDDN
jgi:hypothetical protein